MSNFIVVHLWKNISRPSTLHVERAISTLCLAESGRDACLDQSSLEINDASGTVSAHSMLSRDPRGLSGLRRVEEFADERQLQRSVWWRWPIELTITVICGPSVEVGS